MLHQTSRSTPFVAEHIGRKSQSKPEMGLKRTNPSRSTVLGRCYPALMAVLMLVLTISTLADSRVLHSTSTTKNEISSPETVPGFQSSGLPSSSDSFNDVKSRFLEGNQVYPLGEGPSKKGSGHK